MSPTPIVLLDLDYLSEIEDLTPADGSEGSLIPGLLLEFRANIPTLLGNISARLLERDARGLERAAHALKSSASALGAVHFRAVCQDLESRAERGEIPNACVLEDVKTELGRTLDALESYLVKKAA